jgi:tripartite-type tricarboxylate transporter receptor subunit TctC
VQFVTTPVLLDKAPYDPVKDFAPVIGLVRVDDVLLASLQSSAKTVQQLIALARAQPGKLNYGSFGPGSAPHLDAESFNAAASITATHIPYKGGPEVLKALVTGEIDFAFTGLTATLPLIKDGKVAALAYSGSRRAAALPDVPTLAEEGLKVAAGGWFGWFVAAGTPQPVIDKVARDTADVLAQPEFRERYVTGVGLGPLGLPPAELATLLKNDVDAYTPLVKGLRAGQ